MDKLTMAHDYFMKHVNTDQYRHLDDEVLISWSFDYVDAMQAEAEKRTNKERPDVLCGVDWSQAPNDAIGWMFFDGASTWLGESGYLIEDAPSFGFTGTHIVERPHGF